MLIDATTQTTLGNVYILTGEDDLHVGLDVTLESTYVDAASRTGADAVISWTGTHNITVDGTIHGADEAINLVGCLTAQTVNIGAGGQLFGGGDGVVEDADGVILDGAGSSLSNAGRITAWGSAISAIVQDHSTMTLTNSGYMYGRVSGIWHKFGNGALSFTNTGTVKSPNASYLGGESTDSVTNQGTMIGTVSLGGGDDLYDGRGGHVSGAILGGNGGDRFVTGNHADKMDGGEGIDTLDLSALTKGVVINLAAQDSNAGVTVRHDIYTSIERILSGSGADRLTGDAADNVLNGAANHDTLSGGDGADELIGGSSKDYLTGGAGSDRFVFLTNSGTGDIIADFSDGEDKIVLEGSAFGYGEASGGPSAADFIVSSIKNGAVDASDHFILRQKDATLWYDADGNGSISAVMVADLQPGATLTAASIEFI